MMTGGDSEKASIWLGLEVLARFHDADVELDRVAVERLTGLSCSTVQHTLVDLSRFGYLVAVEDGGYRLSEDCVGQVRCGGGSSASASA
jgi:DNA-binding IclR family transcriptional regulator